MRTAAVALAFALVALATSQAQQLPLHAGQRVRVTVPPLAVRNQQGIFQAVRGDTLVLADTSYLLSDVAWLEVHRGRSSWGWWKGAIVGLLAGTGIGATAGALMDCGALDWDSEGQCVAAGAMVGAPVGLILGWIIGAVIQIDQWEWIPLRRPEVRVVGTGDGVGVVAHVPF
jgi:hypothetical protein